MDAKLKLTTDQLAVMSVSGIRQLRPVGVRGVERAVTGSLAGKLGKQLREEEFELEPGAFCNSGSWSCVPRRLIKRQSDLIRLREKNCQMWAFKTEPDLIWESLQAVANFVGANVENLTFVDNTTAGTNVVLKRQKYAPGDKILLCSVHTYPAVLNQAKVIAEENPGVEVLTIDISFPIRGKEDLIAPYAKALKENPSIKITVIDHISSATAVLFPIRELIELCHQYDVITVIDGAHTPGQIALSIEEYGADFYVGNLCKWLMTPQSVAFLWVHPKHQKNIRPLMTSHHDFLQNFRDRFYPPITKDRLTHVLVKDALDFYNDLGGLELISRRNSELVTKAASMLSRAWNTPHLAVSLDCRAPFMALVAFPDELKIAYTQDMDLDLHFDLMLKGVQVRAMYFDERYWCRLSCNVWNGMDDYEKVRDTVLELIAEKKSVPFLREASIFFSPRAPSKL